MVFVDSITLCFVISLFVSLTEWTDAAQSSINFLVIGDWGGMGSSPYYTNDQKLTANAMGKIGSSISSEFVVALGDNFYSNGVTSDLDFRFTSTWLNIYTASSLQTKWYLIAGNHDHNGNVTAQIAFSNDNALWTFPSEYHATSFKSTDGSVSIDLILIDTIDLAGNSGLVEGDIGYFDPLPEKPRSSASSQWTWIEQQLASSTATYTLVGGHFPIYSVCSHGPTSTLITNLLPLLKQYNAHYMSGHDHCDEFFIEPDSYVNHWLIGMGLECCYSATNLKSSKIPANTLQYYLSSENAGSVKGGFASFIATSSSLTVKYYDQDGNIIYSPPSVAPKPLNNNPISFPISSPEGFPSSSPILSSSNPEFSYKGSNVNVTLLSQRTIYTLQHDWLPELCYKVNSPGCKTPESNWKNTMVINNLAPQFTDTGYPVYCTDEIFQESVIDSVGRNDMIMYWPNTDYSTDDPNYSSHWIISWNKHGTCCGLSQYDYFSSTLNLYKQFGTPDIISNNVGVSYVAKAEIQAAYGGSDYVALLCTKAYYIIGAVTCWTHSSSFLPENQIACPVSVLSEDSCSSTTIDIATF